MVSRVTLFHNCRILVDYEIVRGEMWVLDGKIVSPASVPTDFMASAEWVNCENKIIAPGFIDMQINGAYGHDFTVTDDIETALAEVSARLPECGVTAYIPTLITTSPAIYATRLPAIKYTTGNGATVLGSHIEGPFISLTKRGCHPPELVASNGFSMDPELDIKETYGNNLDNTVILTLAPELPNAMEAIDVLSRKYGVIVSLGHSEATYSVGTDALESGATMLTHLFSAMNAFGHREPSLPGLICAKDLCGRSPPSKLLDRITESIERGAKSPLNNSFTSNESRSTGPQCTPKTPKGEKSTFNDRFRIPTSRAALSPASSMVSEYCPSRLFYGIISDGVHTHPATLRIAYRLNRHGLCLVTDAISALGLPDGDYHIGDVPVEVSGTPRKAFKKGTDTLAGVVASLDECIRHFRNVTGCPLSYALNTASLHPAESLGISSVKGALLPGYDADFTIIDDEVVVYQTWVAGKRVFLKQK